MHFSVKDVKENVDGSEVTELDGIDFPDLDEVELPKEKDLENYKNDFSSQNNSMNDSKIYENITNSQEMVKFILIINYIQDT
jgi:hypothetical protein